MSDLALIDENEIYKKYPFLEGDFWEVILSENSDVKLLLEQTGILNNKTAIAKLMVKFGKKETS